MLTENGVRSEDIERLITDQIALFSEEALAERDGYTPKLSEILNGAQMVADSFKATEIGTEHLLIALIKDMDNLAIRIVNTLGINIQKLYLDTLMSMGEDPGDNKEELQNARFGAQRRGGFLDNDQLLVKQFSRDITELAEEGRLDPVIGREAEINRIIQTMPSE